MSVDVSAFAPGTYEMRGPSAFAGGWRRFLNLAVLLARTDFKTRFFGSFLGYLWSLFRPLALFGVLYAVFSVVFSVSDSVEHYPLVLLSGMVLFWFVSEATEGGVVSLVTQENLVRKIQFPRIAVPLSVVLTATFNLGMNMVVVFGFIAASGVTPRWTWLELPVLILLLFIFTFGVCMILSSLYVFARDLEPIWAVVIQAAFYVTPVLYPIEVLLKENKTIGHIAMCSPLASVIQQFRYALVDPHVYSAGRAIGGNARLIVPIGIVFGTFALGVWLFSRLAPRVAEEL